MRQRPMAAAAAAVATLSISACARTAPANTPPLKHAAAPAVAVGAPVSCVQTNLIDQTKVWNDRTIDFIMRGGTRYRNTLPMNCGTLGFDQRFSYHTTTGQLCDVDTITVLPTGSSIPGPTCGLGKFVPVKLTPPAR